MLKSLLQRAQIALRFFAYRIESSNSHNLHSPFVFQLYRNVICNKLNLDAYRLIEQQRKSLLADIRKIQITDFGAGSLIKPSRTRKVSDIARHSAKAAKFGKLLHRLVLFFKPGVILDLGTSLGVTTAYLASAAPQGQVYTFEGCPATADIAKETFTKLHLPNIRLLQGNMDETLPALLEEVNKVDFVFLDGNHRLEPTLRYFNLCLQKAHEQSVFIFDDIHWSAEMREAWWQVKAHPQVLLTIDLFFIGLVFFRNKQPKQHFVLKF